MNSPNDVIDGPVQISEPLRSGLATSVMYTMAGLGPMAVEKTSKMK